MAGLSIGAWVVCGLFAMAAVLTLLRGAASAVHGGITHYDARREVLAKRIAIARELRGSEEHHDAVLAVPIDEAEGPAEVREAA